MLSVFAVVTSVGAAPTNRPVAPASSRSTSIHGRSGSNQPSTPRRAHASRRSSTAALRVRRLRSEALAGEVRLRPAVPPDRQTKTGAAGGRSVVGSVLAAGVASYSVSSDEPIEVTPRLARSARGLSRHPGCRRVAPSRTRWPRASRRPAATVARTPDLQATVTVRARDECESAPHAIRSASGISVASSRRPSSRISASSRTSTIPGPAPSGAPSASWPP